MSGGTREETERVEKERAEYKEDKEDKEEPSWAEVEAHQAKKGKGKAERLLSINCQALPPPRLSLSAVRLHPLQGVVTPQHQL